MKKYNNFIDGKFVPGSSGAVIKVINPATEEVVSEVPDSTEEDANKAVEAAYNARQEWAHLPAIERGDYIRKLCKELRDNKDLFARVVTEEQGKTLALGNGEVDFALSLMEFAAEWARRIEGEIIPSDFKEQNIFIYREPYGVVAGIIPWNFPLAVMGRKLGPALISGNCIVIKPSSDTPNSAFEFAKLVQKVGIPNGVINIISGRGSKVGKALVCNPKVNLVSITGNVETGQQVMRDAAENLTRISLELGGKAPYIIMDDADLDLACTAACEGRFFNVAGQICIGAERIYVQEGIAPKFIEKLAAAVKKVRVGDPMLPDIDMGPLINKSALEKVEQMVNRAVSEGAKVLCGGRRPANLKKGFFYEGTVLSDCRQDMEIIQKEIFGPVMPVVTFKTVDEAIALANDCEYGLASTVYTSSMRTAMKAANELEFGETYINRSAMDQVQGFHAGWKKSGIGGEDGKYGTLGYTHTRVVSVNYA
jgi:lactaldehyde dehydrogenase/glycolaldehyde dehydrogenase